MAGNDEKNYRIFELYSSIDLNLEPSKLKSQIETLKTLAKLYGVKSPTRRQLKRNIASLSSIYSALERVDCSLLQTDLTAIQESIKKEFENFKFITGITTVTRKEEKRKKVLTSLEDLALLKSKEQYIEGELTGEKTSYSLLESYRKQMTERLKDNPDFVCCNMPIIMNAMTPDFIKLPRLGITVNNTSFGTLWENQWVMAIKKSAQKSKLEMENLVKEVAGESVTLMYEQSMNTQHFPDYNFYWFLPVRVILELSSLKVLGFAMPFPNNAKVEKQKAPADIKALRQARLEKEQEKKRKKCHKDIQNQ